MKVKHALNCSPYQHEAKECLLSTDGKYSTDVYVKSDKQLMLCTGQLWNKEPLHSRKLLR